MSIPSHGLCDQCEKKAIPLSGDMTEDELLELGWVWLTWEKKVAEDEEGFAEFVEHNRHFCSFACATKWCADEINGKHVRAGESVGEA